MPNINIKGRFVRK